jgi:hypothetical protein
MRILLWLSAACVAAWLGASGALEPLGAQQPHLLQRGARVRLRTDSAAGSLMVGTVAQADSTGIAVVAARDSAPTFVPSERIYRLEVSRGRHPQTGRAVLIGALVGGALGFAIAPRDAGEGGTLGPEVQVAGALLVGGIGAAVGAILAKGTAGEQWEPVPIPTVSARRSPEPRP